MSRNVTSAERYAEVVEQMAARYPDVIAESGKKRAFGSSGQMKIKGKIFAFLFNDSLIIKVPRERVSEIITIGIGESFTSGQNRIMKEWVSVKLEHGQNWLLYVEEAKAFVESIHR